MSEPIPDELVSEPVPNVGALAGALLLAGVACAALGVGGQIVVFLVLVVLGPVVAACLGAVVVVEVERAVLYLVVKWRAPRGRLALTGAIAGFAVFLAASWLGPVGPSTLAIFVIVALLLQAALLAYLISPSTN